jgi:hypothetical protein
MEQAKAIIIPFPEARRRGQRIDLAMALALLNKAVRMRQLAATRARSLQLLRIAARQMEDAKSVGA